MGKTSFFTPAGSSRVSSSTVCHGHWRPAGSAAAPKSRDGWVTWIASLLTRGATNPLRLGLVRSMVETSTASCPRG